MDIPVWAQAALWGYVVGSALLIGSGLGYFVRMPAQLIASIMAFGAGDLIALLTFTLMDEAYARGGLASTALGFIGGAVIYTAANWYLSFHGAQQRKRSGEQQPSETEQPRSGLAIAIGSLLDDIPESIVIGLAMIGGGTLSTIAVIGIFLSNLPEGLSSSAGMRKARRSAVYVFAVWGTIAIVTGLASLTGYAVFSQFSAGVIAATTAVAAGAILAMLANTMLPEALEEVHKYSGMMIVIGFLILFILTKMTT